MLKSVFASLLTATALVAATRADIEVTFLNAIDCRDNHGVYRWGVKTDLEAPPETIEASHKLKPSQMGAWPVPPGHFTEHTPRSGREKEWWEVTGKVELVKAESDGDLHIQLVDAQGGSTVNVVVEVPVKQHPVDSPWDHIRPQVFGWTNAQFPFTVESSKKLELVKHPVIRVQGKAFFDATHANKVDGSATNRRKDAAPGEEVTVWEIHPVMVLEVVQNP